MVKHKRARLQILSGWEDVAKYLGKGVRTAQRYERELGLPVRHPAGNFQGSVIATTVELDDWVTASSVREAFRITQPATDIADTLKDFHHHMEELHRLRADAAELREKITGSIQLLRATIESLSEATGALPSSSERRSSADVLTLDQHGEKVN